MIRDLTSNVARYLGLNDALAAALREIGAGVEARPPGRYALPGGAYALVQAYDTRPAAGGAWERHRRFADVQVILEGAETFGHAARRLERRTAYDAAADVEFFDADGDFTTLEAGEFVVFFPGEAHMPCLHADAARPAPVRKLVLKVPVDGAA